ncbi:hypothetical protein V2W45_1435025 [Cenococcum geophilum]
MQATKAAIKRRSCKRRYIAVKETLIVGVVADLIAISKGSSRNDGEEPARRVRAARRCGRCGEIGHNSRTYTKEINSSEDSDESK